MNSYSKTAVHAVVDKLMEIICEQDEEIRALRAERRPCRSTPHCDTLKARKEAHVQ